MEVVVFLFKITRKPWPLVDACGKDHLQSIMKQLNNTRH